MRKWNITGGIETLLSNALLNAGSVVKSVQRGVYNHPNTVSRDKIILDVNISTVNIDKVVILANAGEYITNKSDIDNSSNSGRMRINNIALTSNKVSFDVLNPTGSWLKPSVCWQVIEFY